MTEDKLKEIRLFGVRSTIGEGVLGNVWATFLDTPHNQARMRTIVCTFSKCRVHSFSTIQSNRHEAIHNLAQFHRCFALLRFSLSNHPLVYHCSDTPEDRSCSMALRRHYLEIERDAFG